MHQRRFLGSTRSASTVRAVAFGVTVGACAGVLFGALAAGAGNVRQLSWSLHSAASRTQLSRPARQGSRVLVAVQVAMACTVLLGAGVVARSIWKLQRLELLLALDSIAGVESAAPLLTTPFSGNAGWDARYQLEGQSDAEQSQQPLVNFEIADPRYFQTLGIPLIAGRAFTDADRANSEAVIIVSRSAAQAMWPGAADGDLYEGTPTDPATFASVAALISVVALASAYAPARQAAVIDPMQLLRES